MGTSYTANSVRNLTELEWKRRGTYKNICRFAKSQMYRMHNTCDSIAWKDEIFGILQFLFPKWGFQTVRNAQLCDKIASGILKFRPFTAFDKNTILWYNVYNGDRKENWELDTDYGLHGNANLMRKFHMSTLCHFQYRIGNAKGSLRAIRVRLLNLFSINNRVGKMRVDGNVSFGLKSTDGTRMQTPSNP